VRAGLTPKFKDVETLCSMLDYSMRSVEQNKLTSCQTSLSQNKPYLCEFRPTVDEFSIQQIRLEHKDVLNSGESLIIPKCESGSILIVIESQDDKKFVLEANHKSHVARVGHVYFIDANTDIFLKFDSKNQVDQLDNSKCSFLAYRAYCDIKS
jgi:mannose-6-phosphate isomerase